MKTIAEVDSASVVLVDPETFSGVVKDTDFRSAIVQIELFNSDNADIVLTGDNKIIIVWEGLALTSENY